MWTGRNALLGIFQWLNFRTKFCFFFLNQLCFTYYIFKLMDIEQVNVLWSAPRQPVLLAFKSSLLSFECKKLSNSSLYWQFDFGTVKSNFIVDQLNLFSTGRLSLCTNIFIIMFLTYYYSNQLKTNTFSKLTFTVWLMNNIILRHIFSWLFSTKPKWRGIW